MATNKERIEQLEAGIGSLQEGLRQVEIGVAEKMRNLEASINRMSKVLLSGREGSTHNNNSHETYPRTNREEVEGSR